MPKKYLSLGLLIIGAAFLIAAIDLFLSGKICPPVAPQPAPNPPATSTPSASEKQDINSNNL